MIKNKYSDANTIDLIMFDIVNRPLSNSRTTIVDWPGSACRRNKSDTNSSGPQRML